MKKLLLSILISLSLVTSAHAGYWKEPYTHVFAETAAGQSISNNTGTDVIFGTENIDALNEYNNSTGVFTAKYSGYYLVNSKIAYNFIVSDGDQFYSRLNKDGSPVFVTSLEVAATGSGAEVQLDVNLTIYLLVGESIKIDTIQISGATQSLMSNALRNYLMIDRIK